MATLSTHTGLSSRAPIDRHAAPALLLRATTTGASPLAVRWPACACSAPASSSTRQIHAALPRRSGPAPPQAASSVAPTEITVDQIMIKDPIVFRDSVGITEAVKTMLDNDISGAPVVDAAGNLVGVLSESDVIWKGARAPLDHYLVPPTYISILDAIVQLRDEKKVHEEEKKILSRTVGDAMTTNVVSISPGATLTEAAQTMLAKKVNRLPVVDGKRVVGVLTRHDVLKGIYDIKSFL